MKEALVLASTTDPAGSGIADALIEQFGFVEGGNFEGRSFYCRGDVKVAYTERSIVEADLVESHFASDFHVYVSKHRSESGTPTLTAHFPGNFSPEAQLGGKGRELASTYPSLMKTYMRNLVALRGKVQDFNVVIEATHHGPTSLRKSVLFIEIGSTEKEWKRSDVAGVVAEALWSTLSSRWGMVKVAVGLGGPHYSDKFTKFILESEFALASVASKYNLRHVDRAMLMQMLGKTVEPAKCVALDWKGLGEEKARLLDLLDETGLEVIKL